MAPEGERATAPSHKWTRVLESWDGEAGEWDTRGSEQEQGLEEMLGGLRVMDPRALPGFAPSPTVSPERGFLLSRIEPALVWKHPLQTSTIYAQALAQLG